MTAGASAGERGATKSVTDSWEFHMRALLHLGKHILVGAAEVLGRP
jgi:hypothetical protein